MAKSVLSEARFQNEEAAFAYVEAELWPNGRVCPHCENTDQAKIGRLTTRPGLYKCYAKDCRKQFTVRIGTIFEDTTFPCGSGFRRYICFVAARKASLRAGFNGCSDAA